MSNYTPQDGISFKIVSQINGGRLPDEVKPVPPSSNTGEPTTLPATALIDALTFTFGDLVTPDDVRNLPAFAGLRWLPMEKGDLGYKAGYYADGITILFEGHGGMGTHVRMMGQACRFLEGREQFQGWQEFLRSILRYTLPVMVDKDNPDAVPALYYSAKISRIDAAMDDGTGLLNMERIEQAIRDCTIVSTYRKGRKMMDFELKTGKDEGNTLYFGKRTGDSLIRFYDRAAKMGLKETLIRCELELHDEQARAFAEAILSGAHFGELTAGIIRRKLDFKDGQQPERVNGRAYQKWSTVEWWETFLTGVEKMRLGIAPVVRTLQKGKDWLLRQAAPLIATLYDLHEMGVDTHKFLADLIDEGRRRRPAWQQKLFECAS